MKQEYWVYRNGRFLAEVEASDETEAIEKAQERLITERFGEAGALTDGDQYQEEVFQIAKFSAVPDPGVGDENDYEDSVEITFGDLSMEKRAELGEFAKKQNRGEYDDGILMAIVYQGATEGWWND